jgi:choline-sulfatase
MSIQQLFTNGLPNLVLIITDQERWPQHWPDFFSNLPAMQQLMNTGFTFENAFAGACMCSPSRATFLTSNYPAVTGVTTTGSPEPPHALPPPSKFPNLATVLAKAGYQTIVWKGKWHLSGGNGPNDYGFSGWDAPDAGVDLNPDGNTLGGGKPDNDGRFLDDVLGFLSTATAPFALVASFVNPHDVFVGQNGPQMSGYGSGDTLPGISVPLPANADENLATKPRAQAGMQWQSSWAQTQQDYVNFYAYLQNLVDTQIQQILGALNLDETLVIRIADHGEMGVSHGLVEKFYNAYEESIHIPLIFSNPVVWPAGSGQTTTSMASLLDLMPTLASLLGVRDSFPGFKGKDLTKVLVNPSDSARDHIHFTYDDESGPGPSIIRTIRTSQYAYSVYFVADGSDADWELYDLAADPLENDNVAGTSQYGTIQQSLDTDLVKAMTAMGTLPKAFTWPPLKTGNSRGGPANTQSDRDG